MALSRGPIKNPKLERLGDLPYSAEAVHFDGVSYLLSDTLFLPFEGLKRGADGTQITIAGWFKTVWDNTFTPTTTAKGNSIPVFVVDPVGNYGPSLTAQTPNGNIFVIMFDALYDGNGNPIVNARIKYSRDGKNWAQASFPGQGVAFAPNEAPNYYNGVWVGDFGFPDGTFFNGRPNFADSIVYSYDAINWTLGWEPSANLIAIGDDSISVWYPSNHPEIGNNILINNHGLAQISPININIPIKNKSTAPSNVLFGDSGNSNNSGYVAVLVDPAQGGGALTSFPVLTGYASNSLPSPVTAVRISQISGTEITFEWTQTAITQAFVNANFVGPTWHTSLDETSTNGSAWFYGQPSGAPSGGGQNVGAPGGTPTNPNVQTSIVGQVNDNFGEITPGVQDTINFWAISSTVAPRSGEQGQPYAPNGFNANGPFWQQPVWMHLMFTCNSDNGAVNIYINGVKTDLSGSSLNGGNMLTVLPFLTRLNQKNAVVGGDALGGYYIGDMADFSVWNVDLSNITVIDNNNRQGLPSPYNIFINTANNAPTSPEFQINTVRFITSSGSGISPTGFFIPQPVIMLTGDHITFPQNQLGSALPFSIVGNLSNAATAPQGISSP